MRSLKLSETTLERGGWYLGMAPFVPTDHTSAQNSMCCHVQCYFLSWVFGILSRAFLNLTFLFLISIPLWQDRIYLFYVSVSALLYEDQKLASLGIQSIFFWGLKLESTVLHFRLLFRLDSANSAYFRMLNNSCLKEICEGCSQAKSENDTYDLYVLYLVNCV